MPANKNGKGNHIPYELPAWIENIESVPDHEIIAHRNLKGAAAALDQLYPGGWGDAEIKTYIIKKRRERLAGIFDQHETEKTREADSERRVKEIVAGYLLHFPSPTPNDKVLVTELARITLALDDLNARYQKELHKAAPSAKDLETISKTRKDLLTSFQSLEKNLGIDRESRHQESDAATMFESVKRKANELLKKRARTITCNHCEHQGVLINYGFVVFHLEQNNIPFNFKFVCPRCGQPAVMFPEDTWKHL